MPELFESQIRAQLGLGQPFEHVLTQALVALLWVQCGRTPSAQASDLACGLWSFFRRYEVDPVCAEGILEMLRLEEERRRGRLHMEAVRLAISATESPADYVHLN